MLVSFSNLTTIGGTDCRPILILKTKAWIFFCRKHLLQYNTVLLNILLKIYSFFDNLDKPIYYIKSKEYQQKSALQSALIFSIGGIFLAFKVNFYNFKLISLL